MVMKLMKWPLRPFFPKKYQVKLTLHKLEGLSVAEGSGLEETKLHVDVKWKGPKGALGSRFRSMRRGRTSALPVGCSGCVTWEQDFEHACVLTTGKGGTFQPWHVYLVLCKVLRDDAKGNLSVAGTVIVDVAALASVASSDNQSLTYPITCNLGGSEVMASLRVTLGFVELRTMHEAGLESVHRLMAPAMACIGDPFTWEGEDQAQKVVTRKKDKDSKELSKEQVLGAKGKKNPPVEEGEVADDGKFSPRSVDSLQDALDLFDSDSVDEYDVEDYGDEGEEAGLEKSFSYGTLAGANLFVEGALPYHRDDDGFYNESENGLSVISRASSLTLPKVATAPEEVSTSESGELVSQGSLKSMLSWRKRKLSFRSPRARGEPLLNKAYGEEGGDEIDWDRRQCGSPSDLPELTRRRSEGTDTSLTNATLALDFGEELFTVGTWEQKDFVSRDGQTKLQAKVFFASFDQRSESAAGESACTALVAVIADWLHHHPALTPSKAEFDMLIREGSAEWRNLCMVDTYKDRFPDRHFDLDTILQAAVRPLRVVPEKSFIGFFQPEGLSDSCDFLQGAMSFDSIWEELEQAGPAVYIVSWNDHFFVLKVEEEGCYIIDTLGERLYECCNQAYILQFDRETSLCRLPPTKENDTSDLPQSESVAVTSSEASGKGDLQAEGEQISPVTALVTSDEKPNGLDLAAADVVHVGRGACRQFVKEFFAALPLRELQIDIKKGLLGKVPLHQRLQIEFHFTEAIANSCRDLIAV